MGLRLKCLKHMMQGTGHMVRCTWFRVQGSGFRVQGSWFRVHGSGFRVQGSGFRVLGSGLRDGRAVWLPPHPFLTQKGSTEEFGVSAPNPSYPTPPTPPRADTVAAETLTSVPKHD